VPLGRRGFADEAWGFTFWTRAHGLAEGDPHGDPPACCRVGACATTLATTGDSAIDPVRKLMVSRRTTSMSVKLMPWARWRSHRPAADGIAVAVMHRSLHRGARRARSRRGRHSMPSTCLRPFLVACAPDGARAVAAIAHEGGRWGDLMVRRSACSLQRARISCSARTTSGRGTALEGRSARTRLGADDLSARHGRSSSSSRPAISVERQGTGGPPDGVRCRAASSRPPPADPNPFGAVSRLAITSRTRQNKPLRSSRDQSPYQAVRRAHCRGRHILQRVPGGFSGSSARTARANRRR
jgi:hypothetical protein